MFPSSDALTSCLGNVPHDTQYYTVYCFCTRQQRSHNTYRSAQATRLSPFSDTLD